MDKAYWGPRLWRLLHTLAECSDRRDMHGLWLRLMQLTSAVVPCMACRHHMAQYLRTRPFMKLPSRVDLLRGAETQAQIRSELCVFHNDVNRRLGKPEFAEAELEATYGVRGTTRGARIAAINDLFEELKTAWTPLVHTRIYPADFTGWKTHLALMIALAAAGPTA